MVCPNCGKDITNQVDFCPNCGIKISSNKPSQKDSFKIVIVIGIMVITIIAISLFVNFGNNKKDNKEQINSSSNEVIEEIAKYNTLEKLKNDYINGVIDVNKYFTELVYYEYDSAKLDSKYQSDYEYYSTACQSELLDLLKNYKEKLDEDIVKLYLEYITLANVSLGDAKIVKEQSNNSKNYKVELLEAKDLDQDNVANHNLNKVYLSKNENFLIWYTESGKDAITEDQLEEIAAGLEFAKTKFESLFNVSYSYFSYQDSIFNQDYKNAKAILKNNNFPINIVNTAMSVYVYDTGSDDTLAYYRNPYDAHWLMDLVVQLGTIDDDGVVAFPYIVINKRGFSGSSDNLKQLYTHELFHHFQYLFCRSTNRERCLAGSYTEGMANLASALLNDSYTTNNFLNGHASVYRSSTSLKLADINDGANYGYAAFPYLFNYTSVVENWVDILMNAHNESDAYSYIQSNTSKENLIKIINDSAYKTLINNYTNKSLYSNSDITLLDTLDTTKSLDSTINAGAIDYYEVGGNYTLDILSDNNDFITMKLYGYKDGYYNELISSMDKLSVDLNYYVRYDKFYLVVTNANLVNSYNYHIVMKDSKYETNSEFVTTFNNYNINIKMNITIAGVTTETVSSGIIDELHQKEYLDVTTTSMGLISLNNKIYTDFNSGYSYMTQPYGGDVWWKEKSTSQMVDLGSILNQLISMKNVTKEADNHYKVKITNDDIKGLMASGNADTSLIEGDIYVDVYTENGYIIKLEYDFTDLISGFDLFTTTIEYSNYDVAGDVDIPQSIIDNAKEQ